MDNKSIVQLELIKKYEKATKTQQSVLIELFGEDFFEVKVTDRVKTFEDACEVVGISSTIPDFSHFRKKLRKSMAAHYKLMIIAEALNEGWEPDWNDKNQYKYYPWFEVLSSGFGFSDSGYGCDLTLTDVGSRLCFKSRELSTYAGKQFNDIYNDYLQG